MTQEQAGIRIELRAAAKQFRRQWLFRGLDWQLRSGERWAVAGPNGSGKTTLLRIVAGKTGLTQGEIVWQTESAPIPPESVYQRISWAGPSVELYPALTVEETFSLHFRFKSCLLAGGMVEWLELNRLQAHRTKALRQLSSGLLQRVKVGLALFTRSDLLLLDEPTGYMDTESIDHTLNLLAEWTGNRLLLLATNDPRERDFCPHRLTLVQ
jgi:ABC-type multidrug transport system ATPase subunit